MGGKRRVILAALAVVLSVVLPAGASAARLPAPRLPDGNAKEVTFFIRSEAHPGHVLELHLFPPKGVAVVDAYEGRGRSSDGRSVVYAIAIPASPFDGQLDLHF